MTKLRLAIAGADTVLGSELCARCPHSPAGCCVAPPRYDWSDLARVVRHGFRDWLVEHVAEGDLVPNANGLTIKRPKGRLTNDPGAPRFSRCTFHTAEKGCTIDERQRPATCNFYLCDSALGDADDRAGARRAREVHDELVARFVEWDRVLAERVREWPVEDRYGARFFDWLAEEAAKVGALEESRSAHIAKK
ncbi:MAG TPA: hypothetical protein VF407_14865 [Polyangiaceae bacterium]